MKTDVKAVATALGMTPRGVLARAANEGWPFRFEGRVKIFDQSHLPSDVLSALPSTSSMVEDVPDTEAQVFSLAREKDRNVALGRASLISAYKASPGMRVGDFVSAYNAGLIPGPWKKFGLGLLTEKTFYSWLAKYKKEGGKALVPKWSLKGAESGVGKCLTPAAKDFLKSLYLSQNKLSAMHCWREMVRTFGQICHYSTAERYLSSLDVASVAYHREGPTAFRDKQLTYIDRDPSLYDPMEQVQSDHHHFDFFVTYQGRLVRPWVTVMVDYASSKVVSHIPSVYPNAATVAMAYVKMALVHGAPMAIHTDNGKDYLSKTLTGLNEKDLPTREEEDESQVATRGLYELCGSNLILATPYNGKSKGRTERLFGAWAQYFARRFPTYCGSNTVARPEEAHLLHRRIGNMPKRKVEGLDWRVYTQALDEFVRTWNAEWVGSGKGREGRTADAVFASRPSRARAVEPALMEMHFGTPHIRTVVRCGVTVDGEYFYSRDLAAMSGKKVMVKRLYHRPEEVVITDLAGRLVTRAHSGVFAETDDLSVVLEKKGIETRFLTQKARDLKPTKPASDPHWMPIAAGAEGTPHLIDSQQPRPSRAGKTTIISPLDVGWQRTNE